MKTLLVGYKVSDLTNKMLEGEVAVHTLDIYHYHSIKKIFKRDRVICSPHIPDEPWDLIKFRTGPKLMSGELALDLLQEIANTGARWELDYVGRERDRNELLDKVRDRKRQRVFRAEWEASLPGGPKLKLCSYPGCFCHRRGDEGGLALAEVVGRELKASGIERPKLLDMGCGSGMVGLLVNSVVKCDLTLIDSHTRAIEAAQENMKNLGAEGKTVISDNGTDETGFDVFAGNPPYYSDYRIAEVFLDTARRCLKKGGACYTVVKNAENLRPVQERYFPQVETINRRGYAILKSYA